MRQKFLFVEDGGKTGYSSCRSTQVVK